MKFYSRRFLVTIFLSYLVISVFGQSVQQSLQKRIDDFFVATPQERIMLITDKDIYSPGEIIWFAAFSYEMLSPKLLTLSNNMNLNLISADNAHIATVSCAMKDGMAQGTIQLPDAVPEGVYILQPESLNSTTTANYHKKIGINRNVLPAFAIKAQFIDKSYFPGDQLDMTVGFTDIYNEIKKNVEYKIRYFDGDEEISSSSGKVKKEGVFHSSLQIPASLHTGVISYEIAAESKGRQEMLRGIVPVMSDQIHLFLYPENGKLFDGLKSEVHLYAHDALAKPISVTGVLHLGDEQEIEISTGSNGIGKFTFTPELGKDYFIKLQSPMTLEKKYTLPTVHPKGISLQVVDRNEHSVKYKLTNGYVDSRFFYLAGLNEGNLFWLSEHEIQDTLFVEVSTTKARGMIQMAVINAAVRLEGQHVFYKNEKQNIEVDYALDNVDPKKRSKVSLALNAPNQKGYAILKVANLPWMQNEIDDCEFEFLKFPFDITHEPFTFNVSLAEDAFAEVSKVYSPDQFGWDKILNTSGCFDQYTISEQVYKNLLKADKIKLQMDEQRLDGKMLHTNVLTDSYFATSNPGYYSVLHSAVRHVRVPPYKRMLQNGTPILEVLQTLKPYSIQGDGIVFTGSSNSLLAQQGALIAIDGISRGTNASNLSNINPYDVDRINVSTNPNDIQRYTGLNSVGVIEIFLKRGNEDSAKALDDDENENEQFEWPDYDKRSDNSEADYRTALYFSVIELDGTNESANFKYFNSDLISNVHGELIIVPASQPPYKTSFEYKVK